MGQKACFLNGVVIIFFLIFGCGTGFLISKIFVKDYVPSWDQHRLPSMPEIGIDILHVDINSTFDDPTNDVIYVKSKDGKVFSNSLFKSSWQEVTPVPSWEKDQDQCATEWIEEDRPPVGNNVVDSAGVRIERPTNLILRCYVLLDDGSLQLWVYYISSLGFMGIAMTRSFFVLPGAVIGVILGYFVVRLMNKRISSLKAENAS